MDTIPGVVFPATAPASAPPESCDTIDDCSWGDCVVVGGPSSRPLVSGFGFVEEGFCEREDEKVAPEENWIPP